MTVNTYVIQHTAKCQETKIRGTERERERSCDPPSSISYNKSSQSQFSYVSSAKERERTIFLLGMVRYFTTTIYFNRECKGGVLQLIGSNGMDPGLSNSYFTRGFKAQMVVLKVDINSQLNFILK